MEGLREIGGATLYGAPPDRVPTLMFNVDGNTSTAVATALAARQVAVWAGFVHYNDESDAERLVDAVREVASGDVVAAARSSGEAPA